MTSSSASCVLPTSTDKSIVILGGSYAGLRAASILSDALPEGSGFRVIVVDRNSHFNRELPHGRLLVPSVYA